MVVIGEVLRRDHGVELVGEIGDVATVLGEGFDDQRRREACRDLGCAGHAPAVHLPALPKGRVGEQEPFAHADRLAHRRRRWVEPAGGSAVLGDRPPDPERAAYPLHQAKEILAVPLEGR